MSLAVRLRIRSADDTTDALVISTLPSDAHPYVLELPSGDGQSVDPLDGSVVTGAFTIQVIDANEDGTRVVTAQLADPDGRQHLLSRRAYIEQSTDGGATWPVLVPGYVNAIRLISAVVYEVAIGATRRIEISMQVFQRATAGFDKIVCRVGGPIVGGFGPVRDHGPTRWRVNSAPVALGDGTSFVRLTHVSGWWPVAADQATWQYVHGALPQYAQDHANAGLVADGGTVALDGVLLPLFAGTAVHLRASTAASSDPYVDLTPIGAPFVGGVNPVGAPFNGARAQLVSGRTFLTVRWDPAVLALPAAGDTYDLYAYDLDVSEQRPLYIDMHPVDILTTLWSEAGIDYDATAAAAMRAAMGANLRWKLRITQASTIADFAKTIYGPEGIATRVNDAGALELFSTRLKLNTLPTVTWTADDLVDAETTIYDLDEQTVANTITVKGQRFVLWTPDAPEARPLDDIIAIPQTRGVDNGDTSTFGAREIVYEIPGTIATDASDDGDLLAIAVGAGQQIIDRYGRGAIACDVTVLFDSPQVAIGEEVTLDLPHLPNGSVRGGPRILQAVQKTPVLGVGYQYHLIDSGTNAQTATAPAFTLAKASDDPRHATIVSLTNVATIAALGAGFGIALQMALGASEPTGDGQRFWSKAASAITTAAVRTAPVQAGSTVWIRAQTTSSTQRPSEWTAWQSVTLDAITAPSALTATPVPGDSTAMDLAWTAGEDDITPVVQLRLAAEHVDRDIRQLPEGSTTYRLRGLDTGTAYVATVLYRASTAQGDVSAAITVSFTTGGSAPTLAAPIDPVGVVGRPSNPFAIPGVQLTGYTTQIIDGTYGLDVTTTELLGAVVFEVATETAIGSDTPGSYSEVDRVPPVITGRTTWRGTAPNDGLARYLRAYVHRDGVADSPRCDAVKLFPWSTAQRPEDVPIDAPPFAIDYVAHASDAGPALAMRFVFDRPTSPYYDHTVFTITPPEGGAFTREAIDGSTPLEVPMAWGASYQVTAAAVTTSGVPGTASAPQTAVFGLFTNPGVPIGLPIFDPVAYSPTTGAPPSGYVPRGAPTDPTGLTLHTDLVDGAGQYVSGADRGTAISHLGTSPGGSGQSSYRQFSAENYTVVAGDTLEYDVYTDAANPDQGFYALELHASDGSVLRAAGLTDQNGLDASPGIDLGARDVGRWYHRVFDLASAWLGKTIDSWQSAHEGDTAGLYLGRLANVRITNAGALAFAPLASGTLGTTPAGTGAGDTYSGVALWIGDDSARRATTAVDGAGNLASTVTQSDGVTQRVIAKGHLQGTKRNGERVNFADLGGFNFQNPPLVLLRGGIGYEPRAKWGPAGNGTEAGAVRSTSPQYDDMAALDLDTTGFTLRARLRQKGTPVAQSEPFTGGTLSGLGQTSEAVSAAGAAADDTYTANYGLSLRSGLNQDASCTIAFETLEVGTGWLTRKTQSYFQPAGGGTLNITDSLTAIVPSRNSSSDFRIKIAAFSGSTISCTPSTLTYTTASGDQYASKTPDADDVITWDAIEVN